MIDQKSSCIEEEALTSFLSSDRARVRLIAFLAVWFAIPLYASTTDKQLSKPNITLWQTIKKRVRMRTFSEFMTPAIRNPEKAVPSPEGKSLFPTNVFNIAWVDYEFAPDYRIVYWQRFMVHLAPLDQTTTLSTVPRNPRIGLRRTQLFNVPNLATTYDIYLQPGIAPEGLQAGRLLEMGFRANTAYSIPHTRLSVGAVVEANAELARGPKMDTPFYGWIMPWISYEINSTFSTQHCAAVNFMHTQGTPWMKLDWDLPMPYTQNGVGIVLSKTAWMAVFLNNYLMKTPTLQNTWGSVWFTLEVI